MTKSLTFRFANRNHLHMSLLLRACYIPRHYFFFLFSFCLTINMFGCVSVCKNHVLALAPVSVYYITVRMLTASIPRIRQRTDEHSRRSAFYTGSSSSTLLMYRPHFPTYARNTSRKRTARKVPTGQVQLKRGSADTEHGFYQPLQCMS
jgi:hypothetical protein